MRSLQSAIRNVADRYSALALQAQAAPSYSARSLEVSTAYPLHFEQAVNSGEFMSSRYVGDKRKGSRDREVPAELSKREAQERPGARPGAGGARSPVDSMHVDAEGEQDNARGPR